MTGSFSPMLLRLAAERATGALSRDVGTLYLVDGAVAHAESPLSPGVGVLLTAGGLPQAAWREAVDRAGGRCAVAAYLVERRMLSAAAVEIGGLGALFDAAYFVLGPAGGASRFRHGVTHWFGPLRGVPVEAVERETARRRRLLETVWPYPALDGAPVTRRVAPQLPRPSARQAELLALADGSRTPAEIAAALGRPAFHTLVDVRRLAALGHVVTPREPVAGDAAAGDEPAPAGGGAGGGPVDVATLRRVRDALEARL